MQAECIIGIWGPIPPLEVRRRIHHQHLIKVSFGPKPFLECNCYWLKTYEAKSITDAHDNDTFFTESISRLQGSNDLIRPPAHVHAWGSAHWRKIHDVETSTHDINTSHEKQRPLLAQEEAAKSVSALTGSTTPDQKKEVR